MTKSFFKCALCLIRDNRLLVLEEEGEDLYLLPGGQPEPGESQEDALNRELWEELGVHVRPGTITYLGFFEDMAASREPALIHIDLYTADFAGEPSPCSEVKSLVWFSPKDDWSLLAPVTRNKILPWLIRQGLIVE